MVLVHSVSGTHGTGTQCEWDTMGLGHKVQVHNGTGTYGTGTV